MGCGGASLQLSATTIFDAYLRSDDESSLFVVVQRRISGFAQCTSRIQFMNSGQTGTQLETHLANPGDMLWQTFLVFERPKIISGQGDIPACNAVTYWVNAFAYVFMHKFTISVGNNDISSLYGEALVLYQDISGRAGNRLTEMIGKRYTVTQLVQDSQKASILYAPLSGFWCGSPAFALRTIAMAFSTIKITVDLRSLGEMWVTNQVQCLGNGQFTEVQPLIYSSINTSLLVIYFLLSTRERTELSARTEELVVRVMQFNQAQGNTCASSAQTFARVELLFTLPVLFIMFVAQNTALVQGTGQFKEYINFSGPNGSDPIQALQLKAGGEDLTEMQPGVFWRVVVPWIYFSHQPELFVYVVSFALYPELESFSGTLNFIRLDKVYAHLVLAGTANPGESIEWALRQYATCFTVIRYGGQTVGTLWSAA